MTADWTMFEVTGRLLRRWPLVTALAVLGGLLGFGLAQLRPPVYEAAVPLATSIDFERSGPLGEIEQEYALDQLMAVVDDPDRPAQISERLTARSIEASVDEIDAAHRLGRQGFTLWLTARHQQPDTARQIALAWSELAREDIRIAYDHALQAQFIKTQLETALECSGELCEEQAQARLLLADAAASEEALARGLSPYLDIDLDPVDAAEVRRVDGQGVWVFAGLALGLILSLWLVEGSRG